MEVREGLDGTIFRSIAAVNKANQRALKWQLIPALGYVLATVLTIITLILVMELRTYRNGLEDLNTKVKEQDQTIKMMFNAYPTIVVKPTHNSVNQ